MAGLEIKFNLYVRFPRGALMTLAGAPVTLTCGTNLFVHELRLMRTSHRRIKQVDLPCSIRGDISLPKFVHADENLFFDWPGDTPDEGSLNAAYFDVTYGFSEDGPKLKRTLAPDMLTWV